MPRAPRKRQVNTTPCPKCQFVVRYKNDIARHMKGHAENKEELMIRCSYPGCEYKSLQKSNVVNHTRKHGFSKAYPCPFPNCTYFTLYSRSLTEHMLENHGCVRSPRGKKSKRAHKSEFGCSTAFDLFSLEQEAAKTSKPSSVSGIGPTFSNDIQSVLEDCSAGSQQYPMLQIEGTPPQLMPGQFPFYQPQAFYPSIPDGGVEQAYCPNKYAPMIALNGVTMPSIISSAAYYVPGPHQMQVQHHVPVPMMNTHFQIPPPLPSPASSFSSSSFSDNGIDFPIEVQCPLTPLSVHGLNLDAFCDAGYPSSLPSTSLSAAWEDPAFSIGYPNFITDFTPANAVTWFGEASFAPSTDPNYGCHGPLSVPVQEYDFDFSQFL